MTVVCCRIPKMIKWGRGLVEKSKYISIYRSDARLRIIISLVATLTMNVIYTFFQLGLGIYHGSLWFYALSGYYFLLSVMKAVLLNHTAKFKAGEKPFREVLIYRMCGVVLVIMNLALLVIIGYVALHSKVTVQHEIVTISMAAFTFTTLTLAIVNIVKYRRYKSPVWSAAKAISLVSALVSVLTLEDSMLATFGAGEGESFRQIMGGLTGLGIVTVTLIIAIVMIVRSTKKIKTFDNKNPLQ